MSCSTLALALSLSLSLALCLSLSPDQVHILSVFVVLGVGADDIFVFVDAWRQSASMPPPISSSVTARLTFTQRRATSAVFNTSLTTAIAFFATGAPSPSPRPAALRPLRPLATPPPPPILRTLHPMCTWSAGVSPIMPLAAFGTYAALAIIMNFLLMLFWWPAVMMVWELHLRGARLCGCCVVCSCCPCPEADGPQSCCSKVFWTTKPTRLDLPLTTPPGAAGAAAAGKAEARRRGSMVGAESRLSPVERFFHRVYAPALTWHVGGDARLKPVSLLLILLCSGCALGLISQALQMSPPTNEEVWFPKGHMLARALEEPREKFLAGDDEMYTVGHLYFGLSGLDNSAFDRFDPGENRGDVIFEDAFRLEEAEAQASFLGFCDTLETADCGLEARPRTPRTHMQRTCMDGCMD